MLLGLTCQLDLSRLVASRPCNRLAAQLWGANDAALVEGTSGPGTDLSSAVQAAAPQTLTVAPSDSSGSLVGIQIVQVVGPPTRCRAGGSRRRTGTWSYCELSWFVASLDLRNIKASGLRETSERKRSSLRFANVLPKQSSAWSQRLTISLPFTDVVSE